MSRSALPLLLLLLLCSPLLSPCSAAAADSGGKTTLVFAALPTETPEIVLREIRPLLDYLGDQLGISFKVEYSASHDDLLDKFRRNQVDLAFLGPLPYVALRKDHPAAEPVVIFLEEDGAASYSCSLLVVMDGITDPAQLAGQPLALTQPLSTCGYLVTEHILEGFGLTLEQTGYRYLNRHDRVALAVARGEFAAGGVKTSIGRKYLHLGLAILAESDQVPGRPLIANRATVDAALLAELRRVLTTPAPLERPEDAEITRPWGPLLQYGAVAADDGDFDPLRRMLGDRVIPER